MELQNKILTELLFREEPHFIHELMTFSAPPGLVKL